MPNLHYSNEPDAWQTVEAEDELSYLMRYDFQLLGVDRAASTVEFVLRFGPDGGHCPRHRHLASTTVLVVAGEQHLDDLHPDGTTTHRVRETGAYHRSNGADPLPHMERGGPEGAVVFYSCHAPDGRLFELLDDDLAVTTVVTIDDMVRGWEAFKQAA